MTRVATFALSAVLAFVSADALASVARAVPFEEKVAAADSIVLGRVTATRSRAAGRWIVTDATFEVERAFKGAPPRTLTVTTPGGNLEGVRQETIGVPSFRPGSEQIVFVRQGRIGPTVAYFDQGVYELERDERGRRIVKPRPSRLVLIDQGTGRAASGGEPPRTLEAFESDVRRAMREESRRRMEMRSVPPAEPRRGVLRTAAAFAREHWKLLSAIALALVLALVPMFLRGR